MGYTHYWTNRADMTSQNWANTVADCRKILKNSPVPIGDGCDEGEPWECLTNRIDFNGVGEDSYATFRVDNTEWMFCKTARKPYDIIVVAVLAVLAEVNGFVPTSNGNRSEWQGGVDFASGVLGRKVENPIE